MASFPPVPSQSPIADDGGKLVMIWNRWFELVRVQIVASASGAVTSVNGYTGIVALVKADIGLFNVDNTSDVNKPVSTAQQTALNLKSNIASPTFTGVPAAPTAAGGTSTTQLATTAFVQGQGFVTAATAPVTSVSAKTGAVTLVSSDVGLGNVDNTSDATKNAAVATLTNKTLTSPVINTPTGIVKGDIGLGLVDNTSDATKNAAAVTLTNKTIAAGSNTISGLTNTHLSGSAGVTNANLAAMATQTIKGNNTGGSAVPADLTATQTTAMLNAMVGDSGSGGTKGLVPAPASGDAAASKYLKADGTWTTVSASGVTNFISNGTAETNTTGWATYADAAGTSPVDGTGGSPSLTITRSATTPLVGAAHFLLTKGATNRQGDGASYDFTIDSAYKAKVLQISFEYAVLSGTFASGSDTAASDITVWIYDVTNAVLIQPSAYKLFASSTLSTTFTSSFQSASNSTSYRLIFHCGTTSAVAYTVAVDSVVVGPSSYVYGTPITDWITTWTPTGAWSTSTSYVGRYRYTGDSADVDATALLTGAPNAATEFTMNLPFTIDTAKLSSTTAPKTLGTASILCAGNYYDAVVWYTSTTSVKVSAIVQGSANSHNIFNISPTSPATFANGDGVFIKLNQVPVVGKSSSVTMSSDSDTRVLRSAMKLVSNQAGISTATKVAFDTVVIDKNSAITIASSRYTVQVSGSYTFTTTLTTVPSAGADLTVHLYKNGSSIRNVISRGVASVYALITPSWDDDAVAGDYYEIYISTSTGTVTVGGGSSDFSIKRLSGPSAIAATESVNGTYKTLSSTMLSATPIKYTTKVKDTHGAYNTTTGELTIPVSGQYRLTLTGTHSATANDAQFLLNAVGLGISGNYAANRNSHTFEYPFNAGDKVTLATMASTTASDTIGWFMWSRIGN